mmetsp:Transcript_124061/g.219832  ORF Transcript_124061/g.219832 Transcript_124061/m.219832 type:complete len:328 (-) Transcript_124061:931-1914(-)
MPTRSGSLTSRRNACARRWSSKRRLSRAQSSVAKYANNGTLLPTSHTFSKPKISRSSMYSSSTSTSIFPFSLFSFSLFSSAAFFSASAAAFLFAGSLNSFCFCFQASSCLLHSTTLLWNHEDGWMLSTRVVTLRSSNHSLSSSPHVDFFCHSNRTSSNPSSLSGRLKLVNEAARVSAVKSGLGSLRNHSRFSSSVNVTCGGLSSSTSIASSPSSSSSSSFSSFSSAFSSAFSSNFSSTFSSAIFTSLASAPGFSSSILSSATFCSSSAALACSAAAFLAASSFFFSSFICFLFSRSAFLSSRFLRSTTFRALKSMSDCSCLAFNKIA